MSDVDESYQDGYDAGFSDGTDSGWNSGYSEAMKDAEEQLNQAIDKLEYEKESELKDELQNLSYEYDNKIERLSDHLRLKDYQIESYLNEIYELRKANEELQRTIKKNP